MKSYKLLSVLFLLLSLTASRLQAQEPYAVLDNSVLTFYYDNQKDARNGMDLGPFANADYRGWNGAAKSITKVVFDSSMDSYKGLTSTAFWFWDFVNLEEVVDIQYLHTDSVRSMESMFGIWGGTNYQNPITGKLPTVDMTHFNTSNVENMNGVFSNCANLTSLDLSSFDTRRVTDMSTMFAGCTSLTTINVGPYWTTDAVENSSLMFRECTSLVGGAGTTFNADYIDKTYARVDRGTASPGYLTGDAADWEPYAVLSDSNTVLTFYYDDQKAARGGMDVGPFDDYEERGWHDAAKRITTAIFDDSFANCTTLTSTAYWFGECSNLRTITGIGNFNTSNVTNMNGMFYDCRSLTSLDLSNFNTSKVTNMGVMFHRCSSLTSLDVSHFDTSNVTEMYWMFAVCSSLTSLDVSNFNTSNVTTMMDLFGDCSGLTSLDVSHFDTSKVTDMSSMFDGCSGLTSLDVGNFNTSNVTNMEYMFYGCSGLTSLDVSGFNTSNVTQMDYMFHGCSGMASLGLSSFNTSNVTDMECMFYGCSSLASLDLSHFDTSNVTNMRYMFIGCSGLTSLDLSHFDTSNVTDMSVMFYGCSSLTSLDLSSFNTSNVTYMGNMFYGCSSLTSLDVSGFDTSNVTDMEYMFYKSSSLTTIFVGNGWSMAAVTQGDRMFEGCTNLVGGAGTTYDANHTDHTYAHIDGGTANPGYFTDKNAPAMEIAAPKFSFSGNDLVMSSETEGAMIYYRMQGYNSSAQADSLRNSMTVDTQNTLYQGPVPVTQNVVVKAVAFLQGQGMSETTTMVYDYDAWRSLLDAIAYADNLVTRADGVQMPNDSLHQTLEGKRQQLTMAISAAYGVYQDRAAREGSDAWNIADQITQMVQELENLLNYAVPAAPEAYALLSDNNTVLTFYYDFQKAARGGMDVGPFEESSERWNGHAGDIKSVVFDDSFANCTSITSTAYWFGGCSNLAAITGIGNLNTSNVTDMSYMFSGCYSLTSLDVSHFNTSNVTDMSSMFRGCSSLTSLDVSNFNTSNVTDMNWMFGECSSLTSLDLSNFNTSNVTNMYGMFIDCSGLTSLDVSNFNTSNVINMYGMFIDCSGLTSLDVSHFDTSNVTNMGGMFDVCSSLTSLDLSNFNTSNVTNMEYMFFDCSSLTTIFAGDGWSTGAVSDSQYMFEGCTNLVGGAGTVYDENHTDYTYAHIDGGTANPGYFTDKNAAPAIAEAYAVLSDSNSVLTFYYDDQKVARGGMSVGPFESAGDRGWHSACGSITTVIFDDSFASCTNLNSTAYWFCGCSNLTTIKGIRNLNTSNVTDMENTFIGCSSLKSLDVSNFDTSNVMNMDSMFYGCSGLTSLDLSNFDTSNVTNMFYMFGFCSALTSLDLSNFNTFNVTNMSYMFNDCSSLTNLNLSSFNTSNVTDMSFMFNDCSSLTSLDLNHFNTSNVTRMIATFTRCSGLTSLDLSRFNMSNVTDINWMFGGCSGLTSLDLSSFNTSKVTDMSWMFYGCSSMATIYAGSGWNTAAVTSGGNMFKDCSNLVGGAGTTYDANRTDYTYAHVDGGTANPGYFTDKNAAPAVAEAYAVLSDSNSVLTFYYDDQKVARGGMSVGPFDEFSVRWNGHAGDIKSVVFDDSFANCTSITSTRLWFCDCSNLRKITGIGNLNTSNVTNMNGMFAVCSSLTSLDLSNFNTSNVTDMNSMFLNCDGLTSLDVSNFNTSKVTEMAGMFYGCYGLTSLDVSNFNTSNVTDMSGMFCGCFGLTSLDVSHFDTSNATRMNWMFGGCSGLTSLELSNFNTENVTDMHNMFDNCSRLRSLDLSNFNTSNVTDMSNMFSDCTSLACIQAGNAAIPDNNYAEIGNPNLLVYVNQESLAPQSVQNVVVNGTAKNIVLTDTEEGNNNFYCPVAFTAENIEYTHEYRMRTEIGVSRGWETIALPFTVQTIRHEKNGLLAPFGSGQEGKPFWLRTLTSNGLTAAHGIEANVPYLISMPNNAVYPADYNQAGRVTFSAQNTVVPVTQPKEASNGDRILVPTFMSVYPTADIYAVNRNAAFETNPEGSVFVAAYREVRPFEAYALHPNGNARLLSIDELMEGNADFVDVLQTETAEEVSVYDLSGKLVGKGRIADIAKRLPRGIYIVNGKKVVIK